jgi:hypothetical protein
MTGRPESLVEPLARFVLEVLPWALSGLIGLYLAWGFWSAPAAARSELRPVASLSVSAASPLDPAATARPTIRPM